MILAPRLSLLILSLAVVGAGGATAQNYPDRPVRIVTAEPGGGTDLATRLIAQGLAENMNQQVIVDNKPAGPIQGDLVAKARSDGYTLLLTGSSFWITPFLYEVAWDPVRDFVPITQVANLPNILIVHPAVAASSVKELIALAKAKSGELNYGATSAGASAHLAAEMFKAMAGVNIVRISYKGTGQALNDLIGGQVQIMFASIPGGMPHVKSGRVKALAIASAQPSELAPGMPTVSATGLPGYVSVTPYGVFAPAKTPVAITNRLHQEILRVLGRAEVKEKFFGFGADVVGSTPEQLLATVKAEMSGMGKLIKEAGIRAE